jgi:hypothetical protein
LTQEFQVVPLPRPFTFWPRVVNRVPEHADFLQVLFGRLVEETEEGSRHLAMPIAAPTSSALRGVATAAGVSRKCDASWA